jgi:hypothetical protein
MSAENVSLPLQPLERFGPNSAVDARSSEEVCKDG